MSRIYPNEALGTPKLFAQMMMVGFSGFVPNLCMRDVHLFIIN